MGSDTARLSRADKEPGMSIQPGQVRSHESVAGEATECKA